MRRLVTNWDMAIYVAFWMLRGLTLATLCARTQNHPKNVGTCPGLPLQFINQNQIFLSPGWDKRGEKGYCMPWSCLLYILDEIREEKKSDYMPWSYLLHILDEIRRRKGEKWDCMPWSYFLYILDKIKERMEGTAGRSFCSVEWNCRNRQKIATEQQYSE